MSASRPPPPVASRLLSRHRPPAARSHLFNRGNHHGGRPFLLQAVLDDQANLNYLPAFGTHDDLACRRGTSHVSKLQQEIEDAGETVPWERNLFIPKWLLDCSLPGGRTARTAWVEFAELFLEPKGFTGAQASAAVGGTHDWIQSADGITVLCASAASDRRGWRNTGAPLQMPSAPSVSCTAVRTVSCIIEPPHEGASHSVPGVAVLTYVSKVTETIGSQQPRPHVEEDTKLIRMQELNALVRLCRRKAGIAARCAALHTARAQPPLRATP